MTARQREVLSAIAEFQNVRGYSPSIRELADVLGLDSVSTVHRHLEVLKRQGFIAWEPSANRTIRILKGASA